MTERHHNPPGQYRMRTRLIHGNRENIRWDFDHHLVPDVGFRSLPAQHCTSWGTGL
jgi:hypothetical protein